MKTQYDRHIIRCLPPPQKSPEQKDYFEMVRDAIVHEDNLVNHRLTWLLAAHAFLLALFTTAQSAVLNEKNTDDLTLWIEILLSLIFTGATWMSLIVGKAVLCANLHINSLKDWWMEKYASEKIEERKISCLELGKNRPPYTPATKYPPICGSFSKSTLLHLSWIPYLLALLDILLIAACIFILCQPPEKYKAHINAEIPAHSHAMSSCLPFLPSPCKYGSMSH